MKIQKDNTVIECSKNTYESMYKRLGYEVIEEIKEVVVEETAKNEPVVDEGKKSKKK